MARAAFFCLSVALAACHASKAVEQAQRAARVGAWDEAVLYYQQARDEHPDNIEYRMAFDRARLEASRAHLSQARKYLEMDEPDMLAWAASELERALGYDPTNRYAQDELAELGRRQDASPKESLSTDRSTIFGAYRVLDPDSSRSIRLHFPEGTSLRTVLEALAKLAGMSILFDESFRDKQVSVELDDVSFREALDILMQTNGLFYKFVGSSILMVTSRK
ncbi:MAG: hypothetical protein E2P02_30490 [Acidobacteria bacterium]|nr:MAG: hypothetical protein E2P02_30490 [Acidobacteriota bacterium]